MGSLKRAQAIATFRDLGGSCGMEGVSVKTKRLTISETFKAVPAACGAGFLLQLSPPEWRPNSGAPGNYRLSLERSRGCAIHQHNYLSRPSDYLITGSQNKPIENLKSGQDPCTLFAEN